MNHKMKMKMIGCHVSNTWGNPNKRPRAIAIYVGRGGAICFEGFFYWGLSLFFTFK